MSVRTVLRGASVALVAAVLLAPAPARLAAQEEAASAEPPQAAEPEGARGPVTSLPLPRFVSLRAETANARRGPSLSHRIDWEFVRPGLPLEVTAEYGQWRRVRDADGAGGWVHHTLLSGVRTVIVRGEGLAALQAAPDAASPVRAYVEPGVIARLEGCDPAWCAVSAGATEGWLPRDVLWGAD
jgi:SH3-like domain-containing protein